MHLFPRKPLENRHDIQKLHTTTPEHLTHQELLCGKAYRFRTFTVQCHMTSQITDSGKHKGETSVCRMDSTKDDSPLKSRFFEL